MVPIFSRQVKWSLLLLILLVLLVLSLTFQNKEDINVSLVQYHKRNYFCFLHHSDQFLYTIYKHEEPPQEGKGSNTKQAFFLEKGSLEPRTNLGFERLLLVVCEKVGAEFLPG